MESLGQCLKYRRGVLTIVMHLPEHRQVCAYCQLGLRQVYERWECRFTDEIILSPKTTIGDRCPVEWEGEEDGQDQVSTAPSGSD